MRTMLFAHRRSAPKTQRTTTGTLGRANIHETDEQYLLHMAVPGFSIDDIDLKVSGRDLEIAGTRTPPISEGLLPQGQALSDALERSFRLSSSIEEAAIQASLSHGLLTVVLPKRGARTIPVALR
jgi:HSP20 family protein